MKLQKSVYLLSFLLLIIFTADLHGQFRRKKVKLSETNRIEEFINDHIQDPFMVEHIQAIQSELVKIGFEILPPETNGELTEEIMFEEFSFDPYYGSMSGGYGGTADQPVDVNAIIVDWMKQIKNFY